MNDRPLPPNARPDYWYCDDCKKSIGVISGGPACFDCGSKNVRFIDAPLPPPQARTPLDQLILHAKQLLDWVPTCSKGSSGFVRQENLRKSIEEIEALNASS